jgi:radical SAM/Cys-rich protein
MSKMKFIDKLQSVKPGPLTAREMKVLQVNLGHRCNMSCKHCHINGGPARSEVMDAKTADQVLRVFLDNPFETLDLTGGAPEMNPNFRRLVVEARKAGRHVIARTNLTIFFEQGMSSLPDFYRDNRVDLVASLPYYLEDGVDRVRGNGAYGKSIDALEQLNSLGYGAESSGLFLGLVYNPQGMFLAPPQSVLETEYRRELRDRFGISFTRLYTFANMPIGRFRDHLDRTGNLDKYLDKLACAFNPLTLESVMCRSLLNIGWDGKLSDCDFNQVLGITTAPDTPHHISEFDYASLSRRTISVDDHCYGCTAGQGSS